MGKIIDVIRTSNSCTKVFDFRDLAGLNILQRILFPPKRHLDLRFPIVEKIFDMFNKKCLKSVSPIDSNSVR